MANKPTRNWNDIQVVIATISMSITLVFWNMFAGPDREAAIKRAQEQSAIVPQQPTQQIAAPVVEVQPTLQSTTLQGNGPILLGGSAPQTQIIIQGGGGGGGGGGGAAAASSSGGGGGAATSTRTS